MALEQKTNIKKKIAGIFAITMICCTTATLPAFASEDYIAMVESTKSDALDNYLSDMSLSEAAAAGNLTLNQVPYTMLKNSQTATVDTNLNIRKGCSVSEKKLGTLSKGDKVKILGAARNSKWVYVDSEEFGRGFVFAKYLTITGVNKNEKEAYLVSLDSESEASALKAKGVTLEKTDDEDALLKFETILSERGEHLSKTVFEEIEDKTMYVVTAGTAQRLRVRDGCTSSSNEIGVLDYGDAVTVKGYGINEKWAYVTTKDVSGFVYSAYLSDSKPAAATSESTSSSDASASGSENASAQSVSTQADSDGETATYNTTSLGTFKLTYYCNCSICCGQWSGGPTASGAYPVAGRTIAVDPSVIPLGSKVIINGHVYTAEDTGGSIVGNRIDVYMDSHQAALDAGVTYAEVYLVN